MNGITSDTIATLSQYGRWLGRKGRKYPMVGLSTDPSKVLTAVRTATALLHCIVEQGDMEELISLAKVGAATCAKLGGRRSVPKSIRNAEKKLGRLKECLDTESQPTTPQD